MAAGFRKNRLLQMLALGYLVLWTVTAFEPKNRLVWLLENVPVVLAIAGIAVVHQRRLLSNTSYVLIALLLVIHTIGAHYTYSEVPFGQWLQEMFDLKRNHFDRVVHFTSGLVLMYPMREVLGRILALQGVWVVFVPLSVVITVSTLFELLEWALAGIGGAGAGPHYVGAQGDFWDAQKDMALVLAGAALCEAWIRLTKR